MHSFALPIDVTFADYYPQQDDHALQQICPLWQNWPSALSLLHILRLLLFARIKLISSIGCEGDWNVGEVGIGLGLSDYWYVTAYMDVTASVIAISHILFSGCLGVHTSSMYYFLFVWRYYPAG